MIQRIQSIYLLLVVALMTVTSFSPLLILSSQDVVLDFCTNGLYKSLALQAPSWGLVVLTVFTALLSLINIFLYKKRKLQLNMCNVTSVLIISFYALVAIYYYLFTVDYSAIFHKVEYGLILPFIALIFNGIATIKIKKDEKLVRSLDRIR